MTNYKEISGFTVWESTTPASQKAAAVRGALS